MFSFPCVDFSFPFSSVDLPTQTFAIRFASAEIAQEYKSQFTSAQAEMQKLLSGGDATEGAGEADEAAKAIDALTVKASEEEGQKEAEAGEKEAPKEE